MAITFVQSKTGFTNSATTLDLIFDSTPVQGRILAIAAGTSGTLPVITGTGVDFFAVYRTATNAVQCCLAIGWVQASPSATVTATVVAAAPISMVGAEYSGISLSLDQTASAVGASTNPSSGATDTTTAVNELWLGAMCLRNTNNGAIFSAPENSFAIVDQSNTTGGGANADRAIVLTSRIVSSTGTATAAVTSSVTGNWAACVATLK